MNSKNRYFSHIYSTNELSASKMSEWEAQNPENKLVKKSFLSHFLTAQTAHMRPNPSEQSCLWEKTFILLWLKMSWATPPSRRSQAENTIPLFPKYWIIAAEGWASRCRLLSVHAPCSRRVKSPRCSYFQKNVNINSNIRGCDYRMKKLLKGIICYLKHYHSPE